MVRTLVISALVVVPLVSSQALARGDHSTHKQRFLKGVHYVLKGAHMAFGCCVPILKTAGSFTPDEVGLILKTTSYVLQGVDKSAIEMDRLVQHHRRHIAEEQEKSKAKEVPQPAVVAEAEEDVSKNRKGLKSRFMDWKAKRKHHKSQKDFEFSHDAKVRFSASRNMRDNDMSLNPIR